MDRKTNKEELRGALDDFFARRQSRDIIAARNRPTWIWIHIGMYNRFRELPKTGGRGCRKDQRSFVDLDWRPHQIYTKLAKHRP